MEEREQNRQLIDEYKIRFRSLPYYKLESMLASGSVTNEAEMAIKELIDLHKKIVRVPQDIDDAFYAGLLSDGVNYRLNDCIVILSGEEKGKNGYVISIVTLKPEPRYLIELDDGSDREYFQSEIRVNA